LNQLAAGEKSNIPKRTLKPGGRLIREWGGTTHIVDIEENHYLWEGKAYKSLSAVARAITADIVGGNINACTMMVAERAADFIRH
jgi:hypothetical protein